jgi:RNA polymerase-binding transcription factor DksA
MSNHYEDWADWAGDNTRQAEEDLRKERERNERWEEHKRLAERSTIEDRDGADSAALYAKERREREAALQEVCQHTEVYSTGHCADCGEPIPDFEPTDAQIFAHYGQTKEVA